MGRGSGGGGRGGGGGGGGASEEKFAQFTSTEAADAWAMDNAPGLNDLSDKERGSIEYYTARGYGPINEYLRSDGDVSISKNANSNLKRIDDAMSKPDAIVQKPFTAYRGWGGDFFASKPVGSTFTDNGFVSTSVNPNHRWGGSVATVRVPTGSRGRYIKTSSKYPEEMEFLANRGQTYRVVKNDASGIIVEIVP